MPRETPSGSCGPRARSTARSVPRLPSRRSPGGPASVNERSTGRFPTKAELIRAALDQCIAEDLTPTIEAVRGAADPLHGLAQLIDAAISLGARERNLLTAARRAGSLTPDISTALYEALTELAAARPASRCRPGRPGACGPAAADRHAAQRAVDDGCLAATVGAAMSPSCWTRYPPRIDGRCPRRPCCVLRRKQTAGLCKCGVAIAAHLRRLYLIVTIS